MSVIPELFLFLRVRNNFPGNVSFSCTLRGELGIKEGERTGKSILRWEQREPGSRGTRQAARESTRAWFPGAVSVLRAVAALQARHWQGYPALVWRAGGRCVEVSHWRLLQMSRPEKVA